MARLLLGNVRGPQGAQGATGPQGPQGVRGPTGQGVPSGGSQGMALVKTSGTDYDSQWKDLLASPALTGTPTAPTAAAGTKTTQIATTAFATQADEALQEQVTALGDMDTAIEQGIAILATGNTHAAITSGQYVFVRNHSTLANGLYKASANIAANAALSTSNLVADSSGGLNSLKAGLDTLNSNFTAFTNITDSVTVSDLLTHNNSAFSVTGNNDLFFNLDFTTSSDVTTTTALFSNLGFPKQNWQNYWIQVIDMSNNKAYVLLLYSGKIAPYQTTLPAGRYRGCGCAK